MKRLRLFLLVLLAVLLPIRGAMAASMACPQGAGAPPVVQGAEPALHGWPADPGAPAGDIGHAAQDGAHDGAHHGHHDSAHHGTPPSEGATAGPDGEHAGTCQACASVCCVTPLASAPPTVFGPAASGPVLFAALTAPVPAFQSEGPERPPRTF